jgi:hypothetical protein
MVGWIDEKLAGSGEAEDTWLRRSFLSLRAFAGTYFAGALRIP